MSPRRKTGHRQMPLDNVCSFILIQRKLSRKDILKHMHKNAPHTLCSL
jgi:hypothetical protein